jgi:hypothetical protein
MSDSLGESDDGGPLTGEKRRGLLLPLLSLMTFAAGVSYGNLMVIICNRVLPRNQALSGRFSH